MSSTSYDQMMADKKRIEQQTNAEFTFAASLEAHGVDCSLFMKQWKLTPHQFNTLAHYIHGVNDEEPALPLALKALLTVMETRRAA